MNHSFNIDYSKLDRTALRKECKARSIKGYGKWTKPHLVGVLETHDKALRATLKSLRLEHEADDRRRARNKRKAARKRGHGRGKRG